jgi:hypothetical protein
MSRRCGTWPETTLPAAGVASRPLAGPQGERLMIRRCGAVGPAVASQTSIIATPVAPMSSAGSAPGASVVIPLRDPVETDLPEGRSPLAGDSRRNHRPQAGSCKSRESHLESDLE